MKVTVGDLRRMLGELHADEMEIVILGDVGDLFVFRPPVAQAWVEGVGLYVERYGGTAKEDPAAAAPSTAPIIYQEVEGLRLEVEVLEDTSDAEFQRVKLRTLRVVQPHPFCRAPDIGEVFDISKARVGGWCVGWELHGYTPKEAQ